MNTPEAEEIATALTIDIQRYHDMESREAYEAVNIEWPKQIAVLLIEFLFRTSCGSCDGLLDFATIEPENERPFVTTICDCDDMQAVENGA
jgi:hypothetical protein